MVNNTFNMRQRKINSSIISVVSKFKEKENNQYRTKNIFSKTNCFGDYEYILMFKRQCSDYKNIYYSSIINIFNSIFIVLELFILIALRISKVLKILFVFH